MLGQGCDFIAYMNFDASKPKFPLVCVLVDVRLLRYIPVGASVVFGIAGAMFSLILKAIIQMNWEQTDPQLTGAAWYCARTQPKHEHIAGANLSSRLGLEVFNPRLRLERATRRGVVRVIEPLFPCYIFVRCTLAERLDSIRYTNGISSLVHFGTRIPAVPDNVIEELRQCFESEEPMAVEDRLTPGTEVTVEEGAFLGSRGIVVRTLPARHRVQILLDFLGRTTVAEVDRKSLSVQDRCLAEIMPALALASSMSFAAA
jgi:transcriptional antiterminator RfaH